MSSATKLNKFERMLCNMFGRGYIVRCKDGELYWNESKPVMKDGDWEISSVFSKIESYYPVFEFIRFDTIPWNVATVTKPIKLTEEERRFCEYIKTGYIARDRCGSLYWYNRKPTKGLDTWKNVANYIGLKSLPDNLEFNFIAWEDKKPWAVEDLLKLEAE